MILIGQRLYFIYLCTVYVRSTSIIGNLRNIKYTSSVIPRLFFFSISDKARLKCRTELVQFMWCISRNIRRRISKIYICYSRCYLPAGRSGSKNILSKTQKRPEAEGRGTFLRPRQNIFQSGLT